MRARWVSVMVVVGSGAVVAGLGLGTGAGAAAGQSAQPVVFKAKISKAGFVEQDTGKKGPTPGDATQVRDTLTFADGSVAGRDALSCVRVGKREQECSWTLVLADGTVQLSGLTRDTDEPYAIAVVGGTGTYIGAKGAMVVTDATQPVATYELRLAG